MAGSIRTKLQLEAALKERTRSTPLSRITVRELCADCHIERRTFYTHFHDLYDLVAWVFHRTVDECLPGPRGNPGVRGYEEALTRIRNEAWFFRRALAEDSQNSLGRYIVNHDALIYEQALRCLRDGAALSEEERFVIRFYCFGCVEAIRTWLYSDCSKAPAEMALCLAASMPPLLKQLYDADSAAEMDAFPAAAVRKNKDAERSTHKRRRTGSAGGARKQESTEGVFCVLSHHQTCEQN